VIPKGFNRIASVCVLESEKKGKVSKEFLYERISHLARFIIPRRITKNRMRCELGENFRSQRNLQ
jgi:hypothetical protein